MKEYEVRSTYKKKRKPKFIMELGEGKQFI